LRLRCADESYFQKGKDSSVLTAVFPLRELPEPDNLARFHHTLPTSTCLLDLTAKPYLWTKPGSEAPDNKHY
jgi:hypothetical protein